MRNYATWCGVLLAILSSACNKQAERPEDPPAVKGPAVGPTSEQPKQPPTANAAVDSKQDTDPLVGAASSKPASSPARSWKDADSIWALASKEGAAVTIADIEAKIGLGVDVPVGSVQLPSHVKYPALYKSDVYTVDSRDKMVKRKLEVFSTVADPNQLSWKKWENPSVSHELYLGLGEDGKVLAGTRLEPK